MALWIEALLFGPTNSPNYIDSSIIHSPPFLGPLLLVNYYDRAWSYKLMLAFGPTNSPPLESNTEKEDISSTREDQTL